MSADQIGFSLLILAVLLGVGKLVRMHWRPAQKLFLPASILAGAIGLVLGPGVLGALSRLIAGPENALAQGVIPEWMLSVWSDLPGLLINVVFATLLMGVPLPRWRRVWHLAGPQLTFGLTLGAGQYVIGILLAALILAPVFGLPMMAGALIEIGFEGGMAQQQGYRRSSRSWTLPKVRTWRWGWRPWASLPGSWAVLSLLTGGAYRAQRSARQGPWRDSP